MFGYRFIKQLSLWWWMCSLCLCLIKVGGHYPDLYVWNLHNNHEVSPFQSNFLHLHPLIVKPPQALYSIKTQHLCALFCVGSTDLCTAWWRGTAAGTVSHVWAACDGRLRSEASESVTMTWCRWSQVQDRFYGSISEQCSSDLVTHFNFSSPDDFHQAKIELEHFDQPFFPIHYSLSSLSH